MKMKTTLSLVAAAAVALFSYGAMAQEKSRAEVKEEAKTAPKAGGAGEAARRPPSPSRPRLAPTSRAKPRPPPSPAKSRPAKTTKTGPKPKSTTARADVKAETKAADQVRRNPHRRSGSEEVNLERANAAPIANGHPLGGRFFGSAARP